MYIYVYILWIYCEIIIIWIITKIYCKTRNVIGSSEDGLRLMNNQYLQLSSPNRITKYHVWTVLGLFYFIYNLYGKQILQLNSTLMCKLLISHRLSFACSINNEKHRKLVSQKAQQYTITEILIHLHFPLWNTLYFQDTKLFM